MLMPRLPTVLPAASLLLAGLALCPPALADAPGPAGLLGAWGDDSSCSADVAVFRADGTVVPAGAAPDAPPTTYAVNGDSITFTQGQKSGEFAFGLNDQSVAWSNGSIMVLKERCADQSAFAGVMKAAGSPPPAPATASTVTIDPSLPLFDRVKAVAGQPVSYNGVTIKIVSLKAQPEAGQDKSGLHGLITAVPDPAAVGPGATLSYHVFPSEAAAADFTSLAHDQHGSFATIGHGAGFFSTASATDDGPPGSHATPVPIHCLTFHPRGKPSVTISCVAHMPGTPLVAGGTQSFPLPAKADKREMGPKENLSEVLDLTSIAIRQLRSLGAAGAKP